MMFTKTKFHIGANACVDVHGDTRATSSSAQYRCDTPACGVEIESKVFDTLAFDEDPATRVLEIASNLLKTLWPRLFARIRPITWGPLPGVDPRDCSIRSRVDYADASGGAASGNHLLTHAIVYEHERQIWLFVVRMTYAHQDHDAMFRFMDEIVRTSRMRTNNDKISIFPANGT